MTPLAAIAVLLFALFLVLGIWWALTGAWQEHRARRCDRWIASWDELRSEHRHVRVLPGRNVVRMRRGA